MKNKIEKLKGLYSEIELVTSDVRSWIKQITYDIDFVEKRDLEFMGVNILTFLFIKSQS